jgi:hypothetical protein
MSVRRHSSRHFLCYRRCILFIEVAVVTFQHDLYAFAAGVLELANFLHYVWYSPLIYVIAGYGGDIGRCSQTSEKLKQWLICALARDIPQGNIDQAEASREARARGNIGEFEMKHHLTPHTRVFAQNAARHAAQRVKQRRPSRIADSFAKHTCVGFYAEENIVTRAYLDRT